MIPLLLFHRSTSPHLPHLQRNRECGVVVVDAGARQTSRSRSAVVQCTTVCWHTAPWSICANGDRKFAFFWLTSFSPASLDKCRAAVTIRARQASGSSGGIAAHRTRGKMSDLSQHCSSFRRGALRFLGLLALVADGRPTFQSRLSQS